MSNINYCIQCRKELVYKAVGDEGEQKYCPDCNKFYFNDPVSCVLVTIINENSQVLLLRQNYITKKTTRFVRGI